jgi:hypothetical protein
MSSIERTIDSLETELRVLDRQNAWLEAMLERMDVDVPAHRARRDRSPPVSPLGYRDSLGVALDRIEDQFNLQDDFLPYDDGEDTVELVDEYQYIDDDDTASTETVLYHTEMWGFHPSGVDRGAHWWDCESEESDDETVVGEWEDPLMTPMKKYAPVASTFYNDMSPGF